MTPLPPIVVSDHDGIVVVRDDMIEGGTKRRVLAPLLEPGREYVYASPAQGHAQLALAYAAAAADARATVFVACRQTPHARTLEAKQAGARILQVPVGYMSVVRARARAYCDAYGATLLPFGLDTPEFVESLADLARALPVTPAEVWSVAGSGVLTRALQHAWPHARVYAVRIGAAPDAGRAHVLSAPERFEQPARLRPPFPSCDNYDAKAWRFIRAQASPGALFWNVAA
jgi:hypothetical protein